jgi:hypothetical protein
MEILDISKFSDYIPFSRDGMLAFDLHIDKLIWLRSNKKRLVYGKKDDE